MVAIEVKPRSKTLKGLTTSVHADDNVQTLLNEITKVNRLDPNRIRLTINQNGKHIPVDKSQLISTLNTTDFYIKDLGPQISWRTVFIIEYLGPLIIHPLFYYFAKSPTTLTGSSHYAIYVSYILVILHFLKREYETIFVHKFSNDTMPVFNIFKNSFHYWVLSGFNLGIFIYNDNTNFLFNKYPSNHVSLWVAVWIFAQLSNFKTHLILANLRKNDSKKYVIPFGYGFNLLACPNYFFESLGWFAYAMIVGNWSAWLFFIIASGQMFAWAVKKNKRYLKTFGDDYKKLGRKIYIPYLV